jgi:hypothetical protein
MSGRKECSLNNVNRGRKRELSENHRSRDFFIAKSESGYAMADNGKKSNATLIVVVVIFFVLLMSSSFGFFGWTQGWFSGGGSSPTFPPMPEIPVNIPADDSSATVTYQGLSTSCATSYKVSQDQFATAIPPFDPNKCQGIEIESNCQVWTPVQQGTQWVWQKTAAIDGCVAIQPDTVGVAKGVTYVTDAGVVTPTTSAMSSKDPSGTSMGPGGSYGAADNAWRNAEDSQQIVAVARSGKTRSSTRSTTKPTAKKTTPTPTKTRSNSDPAPLVSTPAYADYAPFQTGLVSYSTL